MSDLVDAELLREAIKRTVDVTTRGRVLPYVPKIVEAYRGIVEDDSPLGHGTPVPEEAELPSGDERIA